MEKIIFSLLFCFIANLSNKINKDNKKYIVNIEFYNKVNISRGLKKINRKNKKVKKNYLTNKKEENECSICLKKMNHKHNAIALECGHVFHCNCLSKWFKETKNNIHCPLCRKNFDKCMPKQKRTKISLFEFVKN